MSILNWTNSFDSSTTSFVSTPSTITEDTRTEDTRTEDTRAAGEGYPRKRRQTRRRLLTAGTEVLAERGPGQVSASSIASGAGVAIGTFYNHFPTVDEFIDAVANDIGRGIEIGNDTLSEIEHDPACRVAIGVLQLLDMADQTPASAAAFASLVAALPDFRARVRGIVGQAIRDGVEAKRFVAMPGPTATNAVLGTTLQSMRSRVLDETTSADAPDVVRCVLRLLGVQPGDIESILDHALTTVGG